MKTICKKYTVAFIIFIAMLALFSNLLTGFMKNMFADSLMKAYLVEAFCKFLVAIIPLFLMFKWGYAKKTTTKQLIKGFLIGTILLLFTVPNLLPLLLINPITVEVNGGILIACLLAAMSIGLMEEVGIRGVLVPLLCEKWQGKKNVYLKVALLSSLIFSCFHLNWSVKYFIENNYLTWEQLSNNLYQVYYTFCFGILAAGVTLYTRSIWPMVFWHGVCDFSAFVRNGLISTIYIDYYNKNNLLTMQNVFNKYGILDGWKFGAKMVELIINIVFLIVGIVLIKKAEKEKILKSI